MITLKFCNVYIIKVYLFLRTLVKELKILKHSMSSGSAFLLCPQTRKLFLLCYVIYDTFYWNFAYCVLHYRAYIIRGNTVIQRCHWIVAYDYEIPPKALFNSTKHLLWYKVGFVIFASSLMVRVWRHDVAILGE